MRLSLSSSHYRIALTSLFPPCSASGSPAPAAVAYQEASMHYLDAVSNPSRFPLLRPPLTLSPSLRCALERPMVFSPSRASKTASNSPSPFRSTFGTLAGSSVRLPPSLLRSRADPSSLLQSKTPPASSTVSYTSPPPPPPSNFPSPFPYFSFSFPSPCTPPNTLSRQDFRLLTPPLVFSFSQPLQDVSGSDRSTSPSPPSLCYRRSRPGLGVNGIAVHVALR